MPRPLKLSHDDYDALAKAVAERLPERDGSPVTIDGASRVPAAIAWTALCAAVVGAFWFAGLYFEFKAMKEEAITVAFVRQWVEEMKQLNPSLKFPNPDKVHREISK